MHFPDFVSARCRQANARNILDQLHAQKTPVGTRRKKRRGKNRWFGPQRRVFLASFGKTLGLVPAEPVFRSQLARSAIWYPYFSQIRKFGTRCSEKPQVRKFASRYSGYQTSCFARRWVPNRQSWRAWVPNPLILSAIFRHEIPNPAVLPHIMRRQVPNPGILPCGRRVAFLRLRLRCIP